ncbi:hypothetical protein GS584_21180, partial [Rhodococcus hoagii]|nr:hypothetical protein [Prescottella equi]
MRRDGVLVGHDYVLDTDATLGAGGATGCTVVLAPAGATAGVDVRGGGPGTRETDLLDPATPCSRCTRCCSPVAARTAGRSRRRHAMARGAPGTASDGRAREVVPIVPGASRVRSARRRMADPPHRR